MLIFEVLFTFEIKITNNSLNKTAIMAKIKPLNYKQLSVKKYR